jgi:hypothetical protein
MVGTDAAERGLFGTIVLLVGAGCLLVALVSVFNVAFDLKLALQVSGSSTALPTHYEEVIGLAAVGVLLIGLTLFGGLVKRKFVAARGKPLVRAAILLGALGLLVLVGRGLQVLALVNTYGSMLAYYATDGDLADVEAELAKNPDRETLNAALGRAAQYDNAGALALLLQHGADMRDGCVLRGTNYEFTRTAIEHGVRPETCGGGEAAVWDAVRDGKDDADVARTVTALIGAGWSATATSEFDRRSAREVAEDNGWTATVQALGGPAK